MAAANKLATWPAATASNQIWVGDITYLALATGHWAYLACRREAFSRRVVRLARSSYYYQPRRESAQNLKLMLLLDEEFTCHNFKDVRGLRDRLRLAGHAVNEKRMRRLVRLLGQEPVYPKPRLSVPGEGVTRCPYLLRERVLTAPNEGWSTDSTYIPMAQGFFTWWPCSTGTPATCAAGSCRIRSTGASASRPYHRLPVAPGALPLQLRPGQPVYQPALRAGLAASGLSHQL